MAFFHDSPANPSFGTLLGQGLGQGLSNYAQLSLANKMNALNQQRQMQQALALRDYEANIMQKGGYGRLAELHRAGIPLKEVVAQYPGLLMNDKKAQEQQNMTSTNPKRQMFEQFNEMVPMQDREAVEEAQEMPSVQRFQQVPGETRFEEKMQPEAQEVGPSGLKKDFLQQAQQELDVEKHPFKSLPKDLQNRVMNRARQISEEFYKGENLKLGKEKLELAKKTAAEKKIAPYLKEVREKADVARQANEALDRMEKLLPHVGPTKSTIGRISAANRKALGEFEATKASLFPAFKIMFPRGFTEKEFNFIGSHWTPSEYNTEERNKGIIDGKRRFNNWAIRRQDVLNSYMDENGNLPDNIENLVERDLGPQYEQDKYQLLVEPGQKPATHSIVKQIANSSGLTGEELVKEVERQGYVFPNS